MHSSQCLHKSSNLGVVNPEPVRDREEVEVCPGQVVTSKELASSSYQASLKVSLNIVIE